MARVTITTNDGTVIDVKLDDEIGDLDKTMGASSFLDWARREIAIARAQEKPKKERKPMCACGHSPNRHLGDGLGACRTCECKRFYLPGSENPELNDKKR